LSYKFYKLHTIKTFCENACKYINPYKYFWLFKYFMHPSKLIVVTGCTRGIGRAVAEHFAAQGFSVAGYARNAQDVAAMQDEFTAKYPQQQFFFSVADASDKADVLAFASALCQRFDQVEVLVNNAGTFLPGSIREEQEGTLETLMQTNVYSAYYLTRALQDRIRRNIFNICSIASLRAYENGASYTISKFALLGFSRQLRQELMHTGIKVTAVMPGAVLTDSWKGSGLPDERFIKSQDIGRIIYSTYGLSDAADLEELIIRPQPGDI
jgi:NADP-dependent 3-hydroxy acid dehydrogenase YdfG